MARSLRTPHRAVVRLAASCAPRRAGEGGSPAYPLHELEDLSDADLASVRPRLLDTRFDDAWLAGHPNDRRLVEMMADRSAGSGPDVRAGRHQRFEARRVQDVWDRLPITCRTAGGLRSFRRDRGPG